MLQQRRSIKSGLSSKRRSTAGWNGALQQYPFLRHVIVIGGSLILISWLYFTSIQFQISDYSRHNDGTATSPLAFVPDDGRSHSFSSVLRTHPRIVQLDDSDVMIRVTGIDYTRRIAIVDAPSRKKIRYIFGSPNALKRKKTPGKCVPLDAWQISSFLSCNNIHETNLQQLNFITCGSTRCVFHFTDMDRTERVLKVQMYGDHTSEDDIEYARRDAVSMERLTSSPYVADIYNYCGTSQMVEYSVYGNLFDWMKLVRHNERPKPTPLEKLIYGIQIATSVADTHSIDLKQTNGLVSLTHNDICCHQFIHIDGIFKLGDFHLSKFHYRNVATPNKTCPLRNQRMNSVLGKIRAPEELHGLRYNNLEKIDVFLMANVMYYILTQKWTFEGITTEEAEKRLNAGLRPDIPEDVLIHPAELIMIKAIRWSWTHDPNKRPTARQVSNMLLKALQQIQGTTTNTEQSGGMSTVVRAPIPPLPPNYDFSDEEFYANIGKDLWGEDVAE